jgi:exopolysaccharide biosynthesis polyprenyl glycosylphosphotransferase
MNRRLKNLHGSLAMADGLLSLAIALASALAGNAGRMPQGGIHRFLEMRVTVLNAVFAGFFMLSWSFWFSSLGLYRTEPYRATRKAARILFGCIVMTNLLVFFLYAAHTRGPILRIAAMFLCSSFLYEFSRVFGSTWIASRDPQLVVILGSGRRAVMAWRQIRTQYHSTVKLVGFIDDRPVCDMAPDVADRYLGTVDGLGGLLLNNVVDELLIAVPVKTCYELAQRAVAVAEQVGVQVAYLQDIYETTIKQAASRGTDLFTELLPSHEDYVTRQSVKRVIDIFGAAVGICLLSPLFVLVAIAVKASSKGPIIFAQRRFGHRRRLFNVYKFRSMVENASEVMAQFEDRNEAEGPIFKIRNDPRVTPIGRFLRATSLDELPQLWNVLLGNMSLVGPRPMSERDVLRFSEASLMRRFTVKPGITGLWQVSARNSLNFDQWIQLDCNYIDDWSLALDFLILARTVPAVMRRRGAF